MRVLVGVRGFEPPDLCVPNAALYLSELHPDLWKNLFTFCCIVNVSDPNTALYLSELHPDFQKILFNFVVAMLDNNPRIVLVSE